MLASDLAPAPAIPRLGHRQPVRHRQVRHATAVLTAALHSPVVHRLIDGRVCVPCFIAPIGGRFTSRTVAYADRFLRVTPDDADIFVVVTPQPDTIPSPWRRPSTLRGTAT